MVDATPLRQRLQLGRPAVGTNPGLYVPRTAALPGFQATAARHHTERSRHDACRGQAAGCCFGVQRTWHAETGSYRRLASHGVTSSDTLIPRYVGTCRGAALALQNKPNTTRGFQLARSKPQRNVVTLNVQPNFVHAHTGPLLQHIPCRHGAPARGRPHC